MSKFITSDEFERVIGEKISDKVRNHVESSNFCYDELSEKETNELINSIRVEIKKDLPVSGRSRRDAWENGWSENRKMLENHGGERSLIPRYFGKFPFVRWDGRIVRAISENFEYNMLVALELQIFGRTMRDASKIYELGCGTGHNMLRARAVNPAARIVGLDWTRSSQEILGRLNDLCILTCEASNFDFLNPDISLDLNDSTVYSIAALEQIGESHDKLVDFLVEKSPKVCIHLEPIVELMDSENNELDKLCSDYCMKRKYLSGFLTRLRNLQAEGKVEIIEEKRNSIGSLFIEGYSLVIWKPVSENAR